MKHPTALSVQRLESACGRASSSAQVALALCLGSACVASLHENVSCDVPGETRRILSVNPTYDWTCFSYALLNVSPMQVESSPPMPCPPPCHSLQNCSLCLGSRGSDGGWQHCVWSMALQQVRLSPWSFRLLGLFHIELTFPSLQCMSPSFVPLRCEAGQCGRLLSGGDSCTPQCSQLTQCSQCISRPQCGWCASQGGNGAGRCLQGGLDGRKCLLFMS